MVNSGNSIVAAFQSYTDVSVIQTNISPTSNPVSNPNSSTSNNSNDTGFTPGGLAGVIIGAIVLGTFIILGLYYVFIHSSASKASGVAHPTVNGLHDNNKL